MLRLADDATAPLAGPGALDAEAELAGGEEAGLPSRVHVATGSLFFEALPELGGQPHNGSAAGMQERAHPKLV
jgi:hypothetical protein